MIYADHAATTPLCPPAREAMEPYLTADFANPSAQYRQGLAARRGVELSRRQIAALMGCQPNEIYFTSGGSEGNSWAVWNGALRALKGARRMAAAAIEHHSLLRACQGMEALGVATDSLPVDGAGRILREGLELALRRRPALVSLQYVNNEVGTVQPLEELASLAQAQGAWVHTDAVQAVGHLPVSLKGVDFLTASAHKFGGPKGIGFLYVRRGIPLRPLIYGGGQEGGLRGGTEAAASIAGMAAALEWSLARTEEERKNRLAAEKGFRETMSALCPEAVYHGAEEDRLPGLISVALPGMEAEQLVYRMDIAGICVSAGAACDQTGRKRPSHVLTAMGVSAGEAARTLRVSFGSATRPQEGEAVARALWAALHGN